MSNFSDGHELVEAFGKIIAETDLAILIDDGYDEVWLPKSQINYVGDVGDEVSIELPEWLAEDKGLL
jgi:hypothetical protein